MAEFRLTQKFIKDNQSVFDYYTVKKEFMLASQMNQQTLRKLIQEVKAPISPADVVAVVDFSPMFGSKRFLLVTETAMYGKENERICIDLTDEYELTQYRDRITVKYAGGSEKIVADRYLQGRVYGILKAILEIREKQAKLEKDIAQQAASIPTRYAADLPVEIPQNVILRRQRAQEAFEAALLLWLSKKEIYGSRDFHGWADAAAKLGHPRGKYLQWMADGTIAGHLEEAGYLFRALLNHRNGDLEYAFQSFANVEKVFDVDGMLCLAWSLYADKGEVLDLLKAEHLLQKTADYRPDSILRTAVIAQRQSHPGDFRATVLMHQHAMEHLREAREAKKAENYSLAKEKYKYVYDQMPWPEIGYEYALVLQYRRETASPLEALSLMKTCARAGYAPAAESLVKYYNVLPNGQRGYGEDYKEFLKYLRILKRVDPSRAKPYLDKMFLWNVNQEAIESIYPHFKREGYSQPLPDFPVEQTWINDLWTGVRFKFGNSSWTVLERQADRVLLLCDEIVDVHCYHKRQVDVTWADSDLRKWMNRDLISWLFSNRDRDRIIETTISNPRFDGRSMDPETKDKLFLLSAEEVKRYFGVRDYYLANQHTYQLNSLSLASLKSTVSQSRRCPLDHFTMTHNWVTRTRSTNYKCAIVSSEELHDNTVLNATGFGIRPAMWVKMR